MIVSARMEVASNAAAVRHPLCEVAESALRNSPYRELRTLRCDVQADALVLTGALSSFYLKQQAQETVRQLVGANRLDNRVHVS